VIQRVREAMGEYSGYIRHTHDHRDSVRAWSMWMRNPEIIGELLRLVQVGPNAASVILRVQGFEETNSSQVKGSKGRPMVIGSRVRGDRR